MPSSVIRVMPPPLAPGRRQDCRPRRRQTRAACRSRLPGSAPGCQSCTPWTKQTQTPISDIDVDKTLRPAEFGNLYGSGKPQCPATDLAETDILAPEPDIVSAVPQGQNRTPVAGCCRPDGKVIAAPRFSTTSSLSGGSEKTRAAAGFCGMRYTSGVGPCCVTLPFPQGRGVAAEQQAPPSARSWRIPGSRWTAGRFAAIARATPHGVCNPGWPTVHQAKRGRRALPGHAR